LLPRQYLTGFKSLEVEVTGRYDNVFSIRRGKEKNK
jgi:hypothetical protein